MATNISKIKTTREFERTLQKLSPFEIKNELISLAEESALKSSAIMLNAGRGNPNWIATVPREAFFLFGQFALNECRNVLDEQGIMAGIVQDKNNVAQRFEDFLIINKDTPGATLLEKTYHYGIQKHGFDKDAWIREWIEAIIGFNYPVPDRMLSHMEPIVHDYLVKEMCGSGSIEGKYDIFAVEGGTAAMCYIFDSFMQNHLTERGDKIALLTPTFTPYIEIPELDRYKFDVVFVQASAVGENGFHTWQYPNSELDKLKDPAIKVAFVVNPSNPPSFAMSSETLNYIADIVKNHNPELMIITDDVYGTFVNDFQSLMAVIPYNTITVYSFSKYFGCTGWRLGTIAIHENNIFDKKIANLNEEYKKEVNERYSSLTLEPEKIKFIDRLVADSRQVALNHTAGLSLPQQFQMMLFSSFCLLDTQDVYKKLTQTIVRERYNLLWEGLEVTPVEDPNNAGYYSEIDVMVAAKHFYGDDFASWLKENFEPVDILFRLAEKTSVVLLNGGGFGGPEWSIRVSLANLSTDSYLILGKSIRLIIMEYVASWEESKK
jgi:aspartate 4-decarboxylase